MKISQLHYTQLKAKVSKHYSNDNRDAYYNQGLPMRRFLWDAVYKEKLSAWICDHLYDYLNDHHIYTALLSIYNETRTK